MTRRWTLAAGLMSGKTTKRSSSKRIFAGASFATILKHKEMPLIGQNGKGTNLQKMHEEEEEEEEEEEDEEAILLIGATRSVLLIRNINPVSEIQILRQLHKG